MTRIIKILAVIGFAGWVGTVAATPIVTSDGVSGLEVGGELYDVAIGDMNKTADEVYDGLGLTPIADTTLIAINDALIALFNSTPIATKTFFDGCESTALCIVIMPTNKNASGYAGFMPAITNGPWSSNGYSGLDGTSNWSAQSYFTYGVITTAAQVSAPGTLALFSLALAAFAFTRRKKS